MNKKALVAVAVLAVVGIAVFLGYQEHQNSQLAEKVDAQVKSATVRLSASLEAEAAPSITWKELFDRTQSYIADTEKNSLALKEMTPKGDKQLAIVSAGDEQVKRIQATLRAQLQFHRARFDLSNRAENFIDAVGDMRRATSSYGVELATNRMSRVKEEMDKAMIQQNSNRQDYIDALNALLKAGAGAEQASIQAALDRTQKVPVEMVKK